jgi:hypothetical protein
MIVPQGCFENWAYNKMESQCDRKHDVYFTESDICYSVYGIPSQLMIQPMLYLGFMGLLFNSMMFGVKRQILEIYEGNSNASPEPLLSVYALTFLDFLCLGEVFAAYSYVMTAYSYANPYLQTVLLVFTLFIAPLGAFIFFVNLSMIQTFGRSFVILVASPWTELKSSDLFKEIMKLDQLWKSFMILFTPIVIVPVIITAICIGLLLLSLIYLLGFVVCLGSPTMLGFVVLSSFTNDTKMERNTFMHACCCSILSVYSMRTIPILILMGLNEAQPRCSFTTTPAFTFALVLIGLITVFNILLLVRIAKKSKLLSSIGQCLKKFKRKDPGRVATVQVENSSDFFAIADLAIPLSVIEPVGKAIGSVETLDKSKNSFVSQSATKASASTDMGDNNKSSLVQQMHVEGGNTINGRDGEDHDSLAEPEWMNNVGFNRLKQNYGFNENAHMGSSAHQYGKNVAAGSANEYAINML